MTQELGIVSLTERGVTVLTASGDNLTETEDSMKTFMRQIAGAFAELEKARLVGKLKHARERIRKERRQMRGAEGARRDQSDAVLLAKRLHRANPRMESAAACARSPLS